MDMAGGAMEQAAGGGYMNRWYDGADGTAAGTGGATSAGLHQDYYSMVHCAYGNNMGEC